MEHLTKRIGRRILMTAESFRSDAHFSLYYALLRIIDDFSSRLHFSKIACAAHTAKDNWIIKTLTKQMLPVIEKYNNDQSSGCFEENAPIWICWWTGEKTAPPLVKQCIKSIRAQAGTHPVYFIDQSTYMKYLKIPQYILQKSEAGQMKLAHLADYIRVALLYEYGGLWLDATIFCANRIPENYFSYPFFTCKSLTQSCGYLSQMRWTTFVFGGWKGNIIFRYLKEAFETYWKIYDRAIDYLFFDYLIEIAMRNLPAIKKYIDQVPVNNLHRDDLQAAMNRAEPAEQFDRIIQEDTVLYKLSWREQYSLETACGRPSVYAYLIGGNFECVGDL